MARRVEKELDGEGRMRWPCISESKGYNNESVTITTTGKSIRRSSKSTRTKDYKELR